MSIQNYSTFVANLANFLVLSSTDVNYQNALSNIVDDTEQRIYRELDLLNTVVRDSSAALTAGARLFTLPSTLGTFVVTEELNVITPAGTTNPDSGERSALVPASKEMLDFLYPSSIGSAAPLFWAPITDGTVIVGPWPNAAYQVEVVGTIRPTPLSTSNVTTLLTQYFPDLFFAGSLVVANGYLKNFGAMADDPKAAITWQSHYDQLMQSAQTEEARKKLQSQGWSSKQPAPLASPPRT